MHIYLPIRTMMPFLEWYVSYTYINRFCIKYYILLGIAEPQIIKRHEHEIIKSFSYNFVLQIVIILLITYTRKGFNNKL